MTTLATYPVTGLKSFLWHVADHFFPHERNDYRPHVLHHRTLVLLSLLLVTIKVCAVSLAALPPTSFVEASAISQQAVLELTNQARLSASLNKLTYSLVLEKAAQAKAEDMLARQYFAHNTPDGKTPWTFFEAVGYRYASAGENLAVHFTDVEPLQDAWMNSPGHRANILNSSFKEMGVGIARGVFEGHNSIFVVEEFGSPAVSAVKQKSVSAAQRSAQLVAQSLPKTEVKAAQEPVTAQAAVPETLPEAVTDVSFRVADDTLQVSAKATSPVAKLLLTYGDQAKFFTPEPGDRWYVELPVAWASGQVVNIEAYDLQGAKTSFGLADITPRFSSGSTIASAERYISLGGQKIPLTVLEQRLYLAVIALLVTAIITAIALRRHLAHVKLVANGAFVTAFATLLLFV